MQNDHLFRRKNKNALLRRVIDSSKKRLRIVEYLPDESDYRDKENIYQRIVDCY